MTSDYPGGSGLEINHIGITVPSAQYSEIVDWYLAALAPFGVKKCLDFHVTCGLGADNVGNFWITAVKPYGDQSKYTSGFHLAFTAKNRAQVREFYDAAMKAGAKDNGAPGLRAHYHPNYYGAFVLDPLGNNIEVVTHKPEPNDASAEK